MPTMYASEEFCNPHIDLHQLRHAAVKHLSVYNSKWFEHKDVYQFGVWCGSSMVAIQKLFKSNNLKIRKMFGLDSFEGLPKEEDGIINRDAAWWPGNFSAKTDFEVSSIEEAMALVYNRLEKDVETVLVPGFWDKVLTKENIEKYDFKVASYIDVDCDIYSSTKILLDFMFDNKLVVPGTLIGYHDWGSTDLWTAGESRAHKEMTLKYGVNCDYLWSGSTAALFRIREI